MNKENIDPYSKIWKDHNFSENDLTNDHYVIYNTQNDPSYPLEVARCKTINECIELYRKLWEVDMEHFVPKELHQSFDEYIDHYQMKIVFQKGKKEIENKAYFVDELQYLKIVNDPIKEDFENIGFISQIIDKEIIKHLYKMYDFLESNEVENFNDYDPSEDQKIRLYRQLDIIKKYAFPSLFKGGISKIDVNEYNRDSSIIFTGFLDDSIEEGANNYIAIHGGVKFLEFVHNYLIKNTYMPNVWRFSNSELLIMFFAIWFDRNFEGSKIIDILQQFEHELIINKVTTEEV